MKLEDLEKRNSELLQVYRRIRREQNVSHEEACKLAVNSNASKYYVGTSYVYRVLLKMHNRRDLAHDTFFANIKRHRKSREPIYNALYERFKYLKGKREFRNCSVLFLTSFCVNCQAPNFLISESVGKKIIEKGIREANERMREEGRRKREQRNQEKQD